MAIIRDPNDKWNVQLTGQDLKDYLKNNPRPEAKEIKPELLEDEDEDEEEKNLLEELEKLQPNSNGLKRAVIDELLDYNNSDDIKSFLEDLLNHGCVSGMISGLIYYEDTNKFFDQHEDEIEDLITENMEMLGVETRPLFIESLNGTAENITQEKNLLAWFSFEETARSLAEELKVVI
jgi:hypothetical protein